MARKNSHFAGSIWLSPLLSLLLLAIVLAIAFYL